MKGSRSLRSSMRRKISRDLDVQSTAFAFPALPDIIAADFLLIASTVYT